MQIPRIAPRALVFRGTGLLERDRDRLAAAFDFAAFAVASALEFAMREPVHHPPGDPPLSWRRRRHGLTLELDEDENVR
jgi:hypothetical protein